MEITRGTRPLVPYNAKSLKKSSLENALLEITYLTHILLRPPLHLVLHECGNPIWKILPLSFVLKKAAIRHGAQYVVV